MRTQKPLAEGPAGPILLCDLVRGAQLPVLVALVRAGGLPLGNKELAEETGVRDDERLAEALFHLARRNLAVNLGRPSNKNEWVATVVARQFFLAAQPAELDDAAPAASEGARPFLPAPATPEIPDSTGDSGKTGLSGMRPSAGPAGPETPEKPDSREGAISISRVNFGESGNTGLGAPEIESVKLRKESFNKVLVSELGRMSQAVAEAGPQELEACYHAALLRGKVYRQLVPPLARALAAAGRDYLPHLLAHIAYSRSSQFLADGQQRPGAYVKVAVQDRALGDPHFMPPDGLGFEPALAWALRGGLFETTEPDDLETRPVASQPAANAEPVLTSAGPQSPDDIWQAALAQLQLALNKGIFETWVRPAVLVEYSPEPETFSLGVPNVYVRDFLEKRLLDQIGSALRAVVGRSVEVKISV